MTNEEMAAELRKAGWRVEEPLTQTNCKHPNMQGSGGVSCDGSGYQESYCMACGYRSRSEWGPSEKRQEAMNGIDIINMWHGLPLSGRRKIAAQFGVPPQGDQTLHLWTTRVIDAARDSSKVEEFKAAVIAEHANS